MTGKDDGGERPPPPGRPATGNRKADWIGDHLRQVYNEALGEAIPQEMLEILSKLDDIGGNGKGRR